MELIIANDLRGSGLDLGGESWAASEEVGPSRTVALPTINAFPEPSVNPKGGYLFRSTLFFRLLFISLSYAN